MLVWVRDRGKSKWSPVMGDIGVKPQGNMTLQGILAHFRVLDHREKVG